MPFYLFRSLSKMVDKVQGKKLQVEPNLFHFSLTNLLVVEELKKMNQLWEAFLYSPKLVAKLLTSPWSKKYTPSSMARDMKS